MITVTIKEENMCETFTQFPFGDHRQTLNGPFLRKIQLVSLN